MATLVRVTGVGMEVFVFILRFYIILQPVFQGFGTILPRSEISWLGYPWSPNSEYRAGFKSANQTSMHWYSLGAILMTSPSFQTKNHSSLPSANNYLQAKHKNALLDSQNELPVHRGTFRKIRSHFCLLSSWVLTSRWPGTQTQVLSPLHCLLGHHVKLDMWQLFLVSHCSQDHFADEAKPELWLLT